MAATRNTIASRRPAARGVVIADIGYDSNALLWLIARAGAAAVIPSNPRCKVIIPALLPRHHSPQRANDPNGVKSICALELRASTRAPSQGEHI
jgi:hypothetical protein